MLGSQCCCRKKCGTTTNSGGAGTTITAYDFPYIDGQVKFDYQTYSVPDEIIVYNTENEQEIYFETGGPVGTRGEKTIYFYKPEGVTSITVKVIGPSGTAWYYTIGCPEKCTIEIVEEGSIERGELKRPKSLTFEVSGGVDLEVIYPRVGRSYGYVTNSLFQPDGTLIGRSARMVYGFLDDSIWDTPDQRFEIRNILGQLEAIRIISLDLVNQIEFPWVWLWHGQQANGTYVLDEENDFKYFNTSWPYCNTEKYNDAGDSCSYDRTFLSLLDVAQGPCYLEINLPHQMIAGGLTPDGLESFSDKIGACLDDYYDLNGRYYLQTQASVNYYNQIQIRSSLDYKWNVDGPFVRYNGTELQVEPQFLNNVLTCFGGDDPNTFSHGPNPSQYMEWIWDGCTSTYFGGPRSVRDEFKWQTENPWSVPAPVPVANTSRMYRIYNPEYPDLDLVEKNHLGIPYIPDFFMANGTEASNKFNDQTPGFIRGINMYMQKTNFLMRSGELIVKLNGQNLTFFDVYPFVKPTIEDWEIQDTRINPDLKLHLNVKLVDYEVYENQ